MRPSTKSVHVPKQYMLMIWNCRKSVCCNSVFNAKKKNPKLMKIGYHNYRYVNEY